MDIKGHMSVQHSRIMTKLRQHLVCWHSTLGGDVVADSQKVCNSEMPKIHWLKDPGIFFILQKNPNAATTSSSTLKMAITMNLHVIWGSPFFKLSCCCDFLGFLPFRSLDLGKAHGPSKVRGGQGMLCGITLQAIHTRFWQVKDQKIPRWMSRGAMNPESKWDKVAFRLRIKCYCFTGIKLYMWNVCAFRMRTDWLQHMFMFMHHMINILSIFDSNHLHV